MLYNVLTMNFKIFCHVVKKKKTVWQTSLPTEKKTLAGNYITSYSLNFRKENGARLSINIWIPA